MRTVALGLRARMGVADAVVLVGVPHDVRVVDRTLLQLAPEHDAFPFHRAMDVPPDERDGVIGRGLEAAELKATDVLTEYVADHDVVTGGVVIGKGVMRIPVERILESSRLFHTAEAEVFQRGLRGALANLGLPCHTITFGDAEDHEAWPIIDKLGKQVGPPWRKDHKLAAIAAWVAATETR